MGSEGGSDHPVENPGEQLWTDRGFAVDGSCITLWRSLGRTDHIPVSTDETGRNNMWTKKFRSLVNSFTPKFPVRHFGHVLR